VHRAPATLVSEAPPAPTLVSEAPPGLQLALPAPANPRGELESVLRRVPKRIPVAPGAVLLLLLALATVGLVWLWGGGMWW
jgi:hypothetical protein